MCFGLYSIVTVICVSRLFDRLFVFVIRGDVVEAVVPHMGESINDVTLANDGTQFSALYIFFLALSSCRFFPVHVAYVSNNILLLVLLILCLQNLVTE